MTPPQLTYTGVVLAVLANQLCLPVPAVVFLMAAGALSAQGDMHFSLVVLLSVLPCVAADGVWFWMGHRWGLTVIKALCRITTNPRGCSHKAREAFGRFGQPLLALAKFMPGLDALIPPLAGAEGVSVAAFVALDGLGSLLWTTCYVALGYVFSAELDVAVQWAKRFGTILLVLVAVPFSSYAAYRAFVLVRMIRRLRVRRIGAATLDLKLKAGEKVALLDLLEFEEENGMQDSIPGAMRVNPTRLRNSQRIHVPGDVDIVLYCSSPRNVVSARVAVELQRIGIENVWVLDGGLTGWRDNGFPLSAAPEPAEAVAERLSVKLADA
jgi:membrane protein DedA with SNARE-associated domain/rhodanese-related sulfurtransferase